MIENGLDGAKLSLNGWNGNVCFWMELVRFTVNRYFVLIRFAPTPIYDEVFWVCFRIQIETPIVLSTESLDEKEITDCLWTAQYKRSRLYWKSSLLVKSSFQPQIVESKWYNTAIFLTKSMTVIYQFPWIDPKKAYKSVIKLLCFLIYKCMYLHNVSWNGKLPISLIHYSRVKKRIWLTRLSFFWSKDKNSKILIS